MEPSRRIDAAVAKNVMGWKNEPTLEELERQGFFPSTDIAAAWEVVEKMDAFGYTTEIDKRKAGWAVRFVKYLDHPIVALMGSEIVIDASIGHAICLSALKALGVEVPE